MRIEVTDTAGEDLAFDWDPATGVVSGPDGWWVDHMLTLWTGVDRLGTGAAMSDPRRSVAGMAAFLAAHEFGLPEALRAAGPPA